MMSTKDKDARSQPLGHRQAWHWGDGRRPRLRRRRGL